MSYFYKQKTISQNQLSLMTTKQGKAGDAEEIMS